MILADFSSVNENQNNDRRKICINSNSNTNNNNNNISMSSSNNNNTYKNDIRQNNKRSINNYIEQMDIPGVKQAYSIKQQQRINQLNKTMADTRQFHLQQSVNRLYSTGMVKMSKQNINRNDNNKNTQNRSQSYQQYEYQQQHQQQYLQQQRQNDNNQQSSIPKPYYNQLYQHDHKFDHQFRVHKLQTNCQLMYRKLFNKIFVKKYKIWVAMDQKDKKQKEYKQMSLKQSDYKAKCSVMLIQNVQRMFVKSVVSFIVNYKLLPQNSNNFITAQDEFVISYSDYLNQHKLNKWSIDNKNTNTKQYDHQIQQRIKSLSHKLPFVYYLLNYNQFVKLDQSKIKTINDVEQWVIKCLNRNNNKNKIKQPQFYWQQMYSVFANQLQNVQFTVPYQTKLYQVKKVKDKTPQQVDDNDDEVQTFSPFRANPIPQSTYQKPKSTSQQQLTKKPLTQPIPFNFTQTNNPTQKQSKQQYYSWNREFKAKPIPKTLYHPQLINGSQQTQKEKYQYKKQHQQKLYKQSKFPKTMGYLQNFNQFQVEKKKQLQLKYAQNKSQQRLRPKEVPDFEKIHKREMHLLQQRKQMNRMATTQPKPFKFAQTKKPDMRSSYKHNFTNVQFYQHSNKKTKNLLHNTTLLTTTISQAKSTAKFDAYIQLRKQQKQQRRKQQQQKQLIKKRQQEDKKRYKDILKQRMYNQLQGQTNKGSKYNNNNNDNNLTGNNNNVVKVNLEQIYLERPLLMQTSTNVNNKNGKNKNDDRRTCFTDSYEPII